MHLRFLAVLALTSCSAEPQPSRTVDAVAPDATRPAAATKVDPLMLASVRLAPVTTASPSIDIPRVTDAGAIGARVNAALTRERQEVVSGREACRRTADGRAIDYRLTAEERYNADGLLSFRLTGYSFCGGANGTTLMGALTFDLHTGEEIDVAALAGIPLGVLTALGRQHYAGDAQCTAFINENPQLTDFAAAFIDRRGVGIVKSFNVGAAEGCADAPALIPVAAVRRTMRPQGPLRRAWGARTA